MQYQNNLKTLRLMAGKKQADISATLEIGQAEYSRIESGKRKATPHQRQRSHVLEGQPHDERRPRAAQIRRVLADLRRPLFVRLDGRAFRGAAARREAGAFVGEL